MQHEDFPGGHASQYYSRPSTLNFSVLMGSGAFSAGMIASNILGLLLPLILAPRHPETTRGPRATASCKYFTTPHPYRLECYNRWMRGKYSRIVTTKNRKKGNATRRECNTRTSQEVTHPSTTLSQAHLTSVF